MFERTQDPTCIIVYHEDNFIIYYNIETQESWIIYGKCSLCGNCIIGAIDPDLRPYDQRGDIPVRPEISKTKDCTLRGVYL